MLLERIKKELEKYSDVEQVNGHNGVSSGSNISKDKEFLEFTLTLTDEEKEEYMEIDLPECCVYYELEGNELYVRCSLT